MENENQRAIKQCPFCAEDIAFEAVKCRHCGEWVDGRDTSSAFAKYSNAQPVWHYVLLSIFTFTLYDLYWFYRTWRQLRDAENWDISPGWRLAGLFIPILNLFLLYDLFKHIRDAVQAGSNEKFISPGWILFGWLSFNALGYLPEPYLLLSFLSTWLIGNIQNTLNEHWSKRQPTLTTRTKLSAGQIIILILGGIFWALYIIGITLPETIGELPLTITSQVVTDGLNPQ